MENNNYNGLLDVYYKEFEEDLHKTLLIRRTFLISTLVSAIGFLIFGMIPIDDWGEPLAITFFLILVISLIGNKIVKRITNNKMNFQEDKFFDNVYMEMVAGEMNADVTSMSITDKTFRKAKAVPGQLINSKSVVFTGQVNGCPYVFTKTAQTVVASVTYKRNSKKVKSYTTLTVENPLICNYDAKHKADTKISIASPHVSLSDLDDDIKWLKPVKMDNKDFNFIVRCNDELAAYKYITADVMEDITDFDKLTSFHSLTAEQKDIELVSTATTINMSYAVDLSKNIKKNIKNITTSLVLADAIVDAEKMKTFLNDMPLAATVHTN